MGKTTTIAKVASKFKLDAGKKVALLSADTYRIAAAEQLKTYANILDFAISHRLCAGGTESGDRTAGRL